MRNYLLPAASVAALAALLLSPATATAQNSGLDWLRFLGGPGDDQAGFPNALHVTAQGDVWVGGGDASAAPARATVHHLTGTGTLVATFTLGTSGISRANVVETDPSGALVYVAGRTTDPAFPVTANAVQASLRGPRDLFVAILDASSGNVLYATYLGGSGEEGAVDLEPDPSGRIWVYGISTSADFPTTANAFQPLPGGGDDLVLACIDPSLAGPAGLPYSTCFGTSGNEPWGNASDLHLSGSVLTFVADTDSASLPTTPGAFQPGFGGGTADAFVARLDTSLPPGSQLRYCTYFGGSGFDNGNAMAVHGSLVCLGGRTDSIDLPTSVQPPAVQPAKGAQDDAYCVQLDLAATGPTQLRYCSYFGGAGNDGANDLTVDTAGNVTLFGVTASPGLATGGVFQATVWMPSSAFVAAIDPVVGRLLYCSYLGHASGSTGGTLVRSDGQGGVVTVGNTRASGLPVTLGPAMGGTQDQFVARWNLLPDGAARRGQSIWSTAGPSQLGVTSQPLSGNAAFSFLAGGAPVLACPAIAFLVGSPAPCAPLYIPPFGTFWLAPPWLTAGFAVSPGERAEFPLSLAGAPIGAFAAFQCVWLEACAPTVSSTPAIEITVW